jgi:hypothetical protein
MLSHLATPTINEASSMATTDAVATITTSACSHPLLASVQRQNEETIIHGKETEV